VAYPTSTTIGRRLRLSQFERAQRQTSANGVEGPSRRGLSWAAADLPANARRLGGVTRRGATPSNQDVRAGFWWQQPGRHRPERAGLHRQASGQRVHGVAVLPAGLRRAVRDRHNAAETSPRWSHFRPVTVGPTQAGRIRTNVATRWTVARET